jgi:hypothetical protein
MIKGLLVALVRAYQLLVSPLLGPRCRFYPTCSNYALEALQLYGPLKGGWLALRRVGRCHPWHEGGVDLVPRPDGTAPGGTLLPDAQAAGAATPGVATPGVATPGTSPSSPAAACGCHHS